jgi:hypothetical protein
MKGRAHIFFSLVVMAGCLGLLVNLSSAQTNRATMLPPSPPLPVLRSPMDTFRTLLVMPAAERKAQLARRPANVRQQLLEKLREYEALAPDECQLRLRATELRWYLEPLMTSAPTNRAAQLAVIPEALRAMVATRIGQWDKFPPKIQQMMLTNQAGPGYFVSGPAVELPPSPQGVIHKHLQERFHRLFELTPGEQEQVLATLSDAERRQMEKTLDAFTKLTPGQRRQCLISFAKFANLNPNERQEFLKNVDRWTQMSAAERQSWRELVSTAPKVPPLPFLSQQKPPLPPKLPPTRPKPAGTFTTNGG